MNVAPRNSGDNGALASANRTRRVSSPLSTVPPSMGRRMDRREHLAADDLDATLIMTARFDDKIIAFRSPSSLGLDDDEVLDEDDSLVD